MSKQEISGSRGAERLRTRLPEQEPRASTQARTDASPHPRGKNYRAGVAALIPRR